MWQIILFIFLVILFVGMFLVGLAILKIKAEESEPEIHPSTDRLFSDSAGRAARASSWNYTNFEEMRRQAQQSDVFDSVTSMGRSASMSDIQQIINSTNQRPFVETMHPTPKPIPQPKSEPEEIIPERESLNAIDDLDLDLDLS